MFNEFVFWAIVREECLTLYFIRFNDESKFITPTRNRTAIYKPAGTDLY